MTSDTRRIYKGKNLLTRNYKSMSDFSKSYTGLIDACNVLMTDEFSICEDVGSFNIRAINASHVSRAIVDGEDVTSSVTSIQRFGLSLGTNVILESQDDSYATITFDRPTYGTLKLTDSSIDMSSGYILKFKFSVDSSTNEIAADSKVEVYLSHSYPVWLSLS